ncbi:MAG: sensor hybrid histidine kinase [Acidimicrobiia bacterium]|nr:sensor hybrid histidine kinase [Acidimicrobiia bacterium]
MSLDQAAATLSPQRPPTSDERKSASVLIVDDNETKRFALKSILLPLGYRIIEADSGVAALRCVMADDFAVILLDVRMPEMDGFETAALVRQRAQSELTPIIFITSYSSDELDYADRYAEGAADFIFAPVPPAELRAKVAVFVNLFIKAQLLAERTLEAQRAASQLRLVTDAAPIGIFRTDDENCYTYTNPRWTSITGVSREDALGQQWHSILGAEQSGTPIADLVSQVDSGGELCERFLLNSPGSSSRMVQVTLRCVPKDGGGTTGWVGTLADVTTEAGADAAVAAAFEASLATNRMQREFAASASHELRTPTSSILGYVEEIFDNNALSPEDREFLEIVYRNAQRLNRLIDDLLIVGHSATSVLEMQLVPTHVPILVAGVESDLCATAERGQVSLTVHAEPDLPPALADPLRLGQALTNLVSNAVKFTESGGAVNVRMRASRQSVVVTVEDTGIGIDPENKRRIFERFYRVPSKGSAVKGSGLGLPIAKAMIEAQNGALTVVSTLGQGSTFTVSMPIAEHMLEAAL